MRCCWRRWALWIKKIETKKKREELYEQALKIDPLNNERGDGPGNIGSACGKFAAGGGLMAGAFVREPYRSAIGMNLAMAFCAGGAEGRGAAICGAGAGV